VPSKRRAAKAWAVCAGSAGTRGGNAVQAPRQDAIASAAACGQRRVEFIETQNREDFPSFSGV
jgi:hypothetical protein